MRGDYLRCLMASRMDIPKLHWAWLRFRQSRDGVAHGGLGGFVSVAQGGKFGSGFAAGAFGKSATLGLSGTGLYAPGAIGSFDNTGVEAVAARTAIAAIAGGIGSELSVGHFANGEVTAAMRHLFNVEGAANPPSDHWKALIQLFRRLGRCLPKADLPQHTKYCIIDA